MNRMIPVLALLLLGFVPALAQSQPKAIPGSASGPLSIGDVGRLTREFESKATIDLLTQSVKGRVKANPEQYPLGTFRTTHLICLAFDRTGTPITDRLCDDRDLRANAVVLEGNRLFRSLLKNEYGQGGVYYSEADFVSLISELHGLHLVKDERCPVRACAGTLVAGSEMRVKNLLAKRSNKPLLAAFAKRYGEFAETFHKERGARYAALIAKQEAEAQQKRADYNEERARSKKARDEENAQLRQPQTQAQMEQEATPSATVSASDSGQTSPSPQDDLTEPPQGKGREKKKNFEEIRKRRKLDQDEQTRSFEASRKTFEAAIAPRPGWPDREFLASHLLVGDSGSPVSLDLYVLQFVDAFERGTRTWKKIAEGAWQLDVENVNPMTEKKVSIRILFTTSSLLPGPYVLIERVIANGKELSPYDMGAVVGTVASRAKVKAELPLKSQTGR